MGSFILFIIAVAAPLAAAVAVIWSEERRRAYLRMRFERLAQDNRGLKLAMGSKPVGGEPMPVSSEAERREVHDLTARLAQGGMLLEWLRLGARPPEEAAARLLGATAQDAALLTHAMADWGAPGIVAVLERMKDRLNSISEMEMVWSDPHSMLDREVNAMADRALWVFEPEYVVGDGHFDVDTKLGAIAKPSVSAGLHTELYKDGEPTLVVELKGARVTVGGEQQMQAWNNVRDLIRNGTIRERDPVDVFVIGGAVDEYEGNPRVEGRHRNVRITSYDYGQLIARAKRLTFGLYDELKDTAPFIRQQRDEIYEAQQAAANQAASDATGSAQAVVEEEDYVRDGGDGDVVRDVDYADSPHRGGEDEAFEIEPHKDAAQ